MVLLQDIFGEGFTSLQSCRCTIRTEDFQSSFFEQVGNAKGQGELRSDNGEIDLFFRREVGKFFDLLRPDGDQLRHPPDAAISRRTVDFFYPRTLAYLPDQRVLSSAATDD